MSIYIFSELLENALGGVRVHIDGAWTDLGFFFFTNMHAENKGERLSLVLLFVSLLSLFICVFSFLVGVYLFLFFTLTPSFHFTLYLSDSFVSFFYCFFFFIFLFWLTRIRSWGKRRRWRTFIGRSIRAQLTYSTCLWWSCTSFRSVTFAWTSNHKWATSRQWHSGSWK